MPSTSDNDSPPPVSAIPPGILEVIPPAVHPHAHDMITIPFEEPAELAVNSSKKLRKKRAMLRAVTMVEREWLKVWESMREDREAKQRGERRSERAVEAEEEGAGGRC